MLLREKRRSPLIVGLGALLILIISAFVFSQYGARGKITRDSGIYLYSGQQMAEGVPPFVSVFDHKGPLTPMLSGIGVYISHWLHTDDILTVRVTFFVLSLFTVAAIYLLAHTLFSSYSLAFLTACTFLNFWGFGIYALSGPQAKTPMVLFEVLALWLTVRRKWFWAGLCGSLTFLTWQPMLIYPLITALLALLQSEGRRLKVKNASAVIAGGLVPLLIVSTYFLYKGAFYDFVDGTFLFNITNLERPDTSVFSNIRNFFRAVYLGYTTMTIPIALSFLAIFFMFLERIKSYGNNLLKWVSKDSYAILFLSLPIPFLWSALDFQDYPDFYVFLPYTAIGFGWLLYHMVRSIASRNGISPIVKNSFVGIICIILTGAAAVNYQTTASDELSTQKAWANEVAERFGEEVKIASIGVPEALVLLHKTNPNPYSFIIYGIDNHIDATTEGGFDGWLRNLEQYNPSLIFLGVTHGKRLPKLEACLAENYTLSNIGDWKVLIRKDISANSSL